MLQFDPRWSSMTSLSSSFVRDRQLILVEAEVIGPTGRTAETSSELQLRGPADRSNGSVGSLEDQEYDAFILRPCRRRLRWVDRLRLTVAACNEARRRD